ncbi:MAG: 3'(2'),5'-bisphosphate nucleotidase CysQ [Candidatus Competibacterales bacterium]|nr:3'(2'),5'-bisphosphate nucleotidase CysQ [Candidatus Competibacterales bacterium]
MADARLLSEVIELAWQAGQQILTVYGRNHFEVTAKADDSPLTAADLASQAVIVAGLGRLTPDIPVLAEESADQVTDAQRRGWNLFWLVDPLDGTKEFVNRNGEFTVNIALVEGHYPVLGVVHVPARGICYHAATGHGAFRQRTGEPAEPLQPTRPAAAPVRVVGSRSHPGPDLAGFVERLGPHRFVPVGSALKFCLVAEGSADVYPRLGPTWWWDTAAAQCVAECAGARVVQTDGRRLGYNRGDDLRNPHFLVYADDGRDWLNCLP